MVFGGVWFVLGKLLCRPFNSGLYRAALRRRACVCVGCVDVVWRVGCESFAWVNISDNFYQIYGYFQINGQLSI